MRARLEPTDSRSWPFNPLWGTLTLNYLSEVMAEGVYEQMLTYLGDPEVHAQLSQFLAEEQRQAVGLRGHLHELGPVLPETAISALRDLSRLVGLVFAVRGGKGGFEQVLKLAQQGERWYAELSEQFPGDSIEGQRYRQFKQQEALHVEWLDGYQVERLQDGLAGQVEAVEFSSIVPAPIEEVFAFYTDTRSLPVLTGLPVSCPEGITRFKEGDRFHLNIGYGPWPLKVDAHIVAMDAPLFFVDRKIDVPFDRWEHHHHFTPLGPRETLVSDRLLVRPKFFPPVPDALQPSPWKLGLLAMLWYRHRRAHKAFQR